MKTKEEIHRKHVLFNHIIDCILFTILSVIAAITFKLAIAVNSRAVGLLLDCLGGLACVGISVCAKFSRK